MPKKRTPEEALLEKRIELLATRILQKKCKQKVVELSLERGLRFGRSMLRANSYIGEGDLVSVVGQALSESADRFHARKAFSETELDKLHPDNIHMSDEDKVNYLVTRFTTFAYKNIKGCLTTHIDREAHAHQHYNYEDQDELFQSAHSVKESCPEQSMLDQQMRDLLDDALATLSPRSQRVMRMRMRGMRVNDIAEKEGLNRTSVSRLITESVKTLRGYVAENIKHQGAQDIPRDIADSNVVEFRHPQRKRSKAA